MTTLAISLAPAAAPVRRRQARLVPSKVILSQNLQPGAWYDVCTGRRRGDDRAGMVLLDLGSHREHFPAGCLEFRDAQPALQRARRSAVAAALAALPVAAVLLVAARHFGTRG